MTLVVGVAPESPGRAALHVAAMLARSGGEDLLLCAVVPSPWPPGLARVDAEYREHLEGSAREALEEASAHVPEDVGAATAVQHARSAPAGLIDVAEQRDASAIVAGSSAAGVFGHVSLGSVSDRLVHSSPVPVALATRGFRCRPDARVTRVTAAYGGAEDELVVAAARVAARVGATLRIASFAVRARPPYTSGVGREAQGSIMREWAREIDAGARTALERVKALAQVPPGVTAEIGAGETWDDALEDVEWDDGDLLVVGSSTIGPVARVFLGSRASKIVRHSPVPVLVVPRAAAAELAGAVA